MKCNKCNNRMKVGDGTGEVCIGGDGIVKAPCLIHGELGYDCVDITCKRFTPKLKTVDPTATCGDCKHCEMLIGGNTAMLCELRRINTTRETTACVLIDAKEPKSERLKAKDCQFRGWNQDAGVITCERTASHVTCPRLDGGDACDDGEPVA